MTNRQRHPDYFQLRNKINACEKLHQLDNLRQVTAETNRLFKDTKWNDDGIDLMIIFMQKEAELEATIDIRFKQVLESKFHQNHLGV